MPFSWLYSLYYSISCYISCIGFFTAKTLCLLPISISLYPQHSPNSVFCLANSSSCFFNYHCCLSEMTINSFSALSSNLCHYLECFNLISAISCSLSHSFPSLPCLLPPSGVELRILELLSSDYCQKQIHSFISSLKKAQLRFLDKHKAK